MGLGPGSGRRDDHLGRGRCLTVKCRYVRMSAIHIADTLMSPEIHCRSTRYASMAHPRQDSPENAYRPFLSLILFRRSPVGDG
jgi:hypothetical protein